MEIRRLARAALRGTPLLALWALAPAGQDIFVDIFEVDKSRLKDRGRNDYFNLEPGHRLELKGGDTRLVITVLGETKQVDGVKTRVVEEREWEGGRLIEVSRNFFAIDPEAKDVYYFGEDVDMYRSGKIVSHEGAWRSGVGGARFGLMMPGDPKVGAAFYQEIAPKVAMDRAKIVGFATVETHAGRFDKCLKVEETTPLEPGVKEYKYYATGIGLIQDAELKLVRRP